MIDDIALGDIEAFLDREALFASRWQFRQGSDASSWERLKVEKVIPIYERFLSLCHAESIIKPKIVYGHFRCERNGNGLVLHDEARAYRFDLPRECETPNRCVADFFETGFATLQLVTVGDGATKAATEKFSDHKYSDAFFIKGLAAEFAEAAAKYSHDLIRRELGVGDGVGERFSPGYPSFPDLSAQKKIAALLKPMRIGVSLTSTYQLVPEQSTSALISIDEKATHFRP